jgi:AraC-like DNA-binding protein
MLHFCVMPLDKKTRLPRQFEVNKTAFEVILPKADETFLWRLDDYPWERNVWNFHPEVEIHLLRKSSGIILVGDHIGEFKAGELTVVGSNLPHDWVTPLADGELIEGRDIVIQFRPERLLECVQHLPELQRCEEFFERARRGLSFHSETREQATQIIENMGRLGGLAKLGSFLELLHMLSHSDQCTVLSSHTYAPDLEYGSKDTLQKVFSYIFTHISEEIRLPDVAALINMTESTFSRFFKRNSGHSFTDHVNQLRIWKASQLLADTEMPITEICFEVGYLNMSNFNRMFLRHHNVTPSTYRKLAGLRHFRRSQAN